MKLSNGDKYYIYPVNFVYINYKLLCKLSTTGEYDGVVTKLYQIII